MRDTDAANETLFPRFSHWVLLGFIEALGTTTACASREEQPQSQAGPAITTGQVGRWR